MAALVKNELHKDPFTGTVFVFRSRKADRLKLIYWDGSGNRHGLQTAGKSTHSLGPHQGWADDAHHAQFEALFAGLDWRRVHAVQTRTPEAIE